MADARAVGQANPEPLATQPRDALLGLQHVLGGDPSGQHKDLGPRQLDMAAREGDADRRIADAGRPVARRPPGQDVGDVEVAFAAHADGGEHAVHQLAADADERLAQPVLVLARRLADNHHRGAGDAVGEYRVLGQALERAALEGTNRGLQLGQGVGAGGRRACVLDQPRRFQRHRRTWRRRDRRARRHRRFAHAARQWRRGRCRGRSGAGGERVAILGLLQAAILDAGIGVPAQQGGGIGQRRGAVHGARRMVSDGSIVHRLVPRALVRPDDPPYMEGIEFWPDYRAVSPEA